MCALTRMSLLAGTVVALAIPAAALAQSAGRQLCMHVVTDRTVGEVLNSTTTVTYCTYIDRPRDLPTRLRR